MAHYQAKFFSSLKRVGSVAPTRAASRFGSPKPGAAKTGPTGLSNGVNSQGDIITGDALTARLKDVAADGHIGSGGVMNGTTPLLGLEVSVHRFQKYIFKSPLIGFCCRLGTSWAVLRLPWRIC
jgi:hypothetical protein